jgi:hypothetical protein
MAAAIIGVTPPVAATGIRTHLLRLLRRLAARVCTPGSSDVVPEFYKYPPV